MKRKRVVAGSSGENVDVKQTEEIEEFKASLKRSGADDKLMHSILENDKETIENGKLISDSINNNIDLTPNVLFEHIVKDYKFAEKLFGERILRVISGYEPGYIEKNIAIPEFQREFKKRIEEKIEDLKDKGLLGKDNSLTEKGLELASLTLCAEELDNIIPKGMFGKQFVKKGSHYGDKGDTKDYKKGERYRDIALRRSIKTAIRRGHLGLIREDLKSFERQSKGQCYIIYALDASGSMKGKKIEMGKKAGIALAYKAISNKDKVGLVVFGHNVKEEIRPTEDFIRLLKSITGIRASRETNIAKTIEKCIRMFPDENATKHIVLLSDALPTAGKEPEKETLNAVSVANTRDITISVIGISLDRKGKELAKKIVELGKGRFYIAKSLEEIDKIVLEDYYWVG